MVGSGLVEFAMPPQDARRPKKQPDDQQPVQLEAAPDTVLLRLARAGDQKAGSALVARHLPDMYHWAFHVLHKRDDAADAVQQTWAKVWRSEIHTSFRGFLRKTLDNCCIDTIREREKRRAMDSRELENANPIDHCSQEPSIKLVEDEQNSRVMAAVKKLNPKLRRVIELRLAGRSNKDIAEECGITPGTLQTRLQRAHRKLRGPLGELDPTLERHPGGENELPRKNGAVDHPTHQHPALAHDDIVDHPLLPGTKS